jgi:hypothetical protein
MGPLGFGQYIPCGGAPRRESLEKRWPDPLGRRKGRRKEEKPRRITPSASGSTGLAGRATTLGWAPLQLGAQGQIY